MRFTGQVRVPEVDHPGVPAIFLVEDGQAEVLLDGESLGRWSLFDVHASRLVSSAFSVSLDGEEITFIADEPVDFAYKGVDHMAEAWARYKAMTIPRRMVAVGRSRRGTRTSRIPELRDAMLANLEVYAATVVDDPDGVEELEVVERPIRFTPRPESRIVEASAPAAGPEIATEASEDAAESGEDDAPSLTASLRPGPGLVSRRIPVESVPELDPIEAFQPEPDPVPVAELVSEPEPVPIVQVEEIAPETFAVVEPEPVAPVEMEPEPEQVPVAESESEPEPELGAGVGAGVGAGTGRRGRRGVGRSGGRGDPGIARSRAACRRGARSRLCPRPRTRSGPSPATRGRPRCL